MLAFALWLALLTGGVHPTLAGVAVALLDPGVHPAAPRRSRTAVEVIRAFRQSPNSRLRRAPRRRSLRESISINERLQTQLRPVRRRSWCCRLFALANAGVSTGRPDRVCGAARSPLTWGIIAGLVVGKLVGITGATALVRATGLGQLAPGMTLRRVAGGAALSGIGFTISLFIVDLAIADPAKQDEARVGVLVASVLALALGWAIFRDHRLDQPAGVRGRQVDPGDRP